jgi:hypothetical protein
MTKMGGKNVSPVRDLSHSLAQHDSAVSKSTAVYICEAF